MWLPSLLCSLETKLSQENTLDLTTGASESNEPKAASCGTPSLVDKWRKFSS